eukprot:1157832-Pelagomonas_calceolata.AAC.2
MAGTPKNKFRNIPNTRESSIEYKKPPIEVKSCLDFNAYRVRPARQMKHSSKGAETTKRAPPGAMDGVYTKVPDAGLFCSLA